MEIVYVTMAGLTAASIAYLFMAFFSDVPGLASEGKPEDISGRTAANLKELDFDYAAGKLSKDDYESAHQQAVAELALSLKAKQEKSQ